MKSLLRGSILLPSLIGLAASVSIGAAPPTNTATGKYLDTSNAAEIEAVRHYLRSRAAAWRTAGK